MKFFDLSQLQGLIFRSPVTLFELGKAINEKGIKMVFFVTEEYSLEGVLTDGDFRRLLMSGVPLSSSSEQFINRYPVTADSNGFPESLRENVTIPVIDENNRLIGAWSEAQFGGRKFDNSVVIMAGGLGSRMGDLTKTCPKPMLKVGGKPMLERIVARFVHAGFSNIIISVNYLADVIKSHFGDGKKFGCSISYISETKKLGTIGSLALARDFIKEPFVVANGDVLTSFNYDVLPSMHAFMGLPAAIVVTCPYDVAIPFGVIKSSGLNIVSIEEKPIKSYDVSAGIYFFSPEVFNFIDDDEFLDAPDLINRIIQSNQKICLFRYSGPWRDHAFPEDLSKY